MNHTGVASTGCRRQALMNRVAASASVHLEKRTGEADEILEPHRFEPQLGAELAQLIRDRVVEEVVASDDGDGNVALVFDGAQAAEKPEAVDERHAQIEDDGVRVASLRFAKPHLGR